VNLLVLAQYNTALVRTV